MPLTSERLPYILKAADPAHVGAPTSGFPHVMSAQKASLSMVTVYAIALERVSKITLSRCVGVLATHGDPPDVIAQWFVASDQFHVPPTQYLLAIV